MRDGFVIELFGKEEPCPAFIENSREAWESDPRAFAAIVHFPNGHRHEVVALWPRDIPPPNLEDLDSAAIQRDAVQFVVPGEVSCQVCGTTSKGLWMLGGLWFGGNRRRHRLRRCTVCDADFVHSGLLFLDR
jgi:hypothetical protein